MSEKKILVKSNYWNYVVSQVINLVVNQKKMKAIKCPKNQAIGAKF